MTARRKVAEAAGPVPMLHNITVTLASDPRIDTVLAAVELLREEVAALTEQGADSRQRIQQVLVEAAILQDQSGELLQLVRQIITSQEAHMVKLADLENAAARLEEQNTSLSGTVTQAVTLIQETHTEIGTLRTELASARDNGSDEEIQAVIARLDAVHARSGEQIAALTSALSGVADGGDTPEPAPEPGPDVVEPAPEPAPVEDGTDTVEGGEDTVPGA